MKYRYGKWRPEEDKKSQLEKLIGLFNMLLLRTGGNVEEAIEWLKYLNQRYGFFKGESELHDFIKRMEKEGYIQRDKNRFIVTSKGGLRIRQDSLRQVFSGMKKGGFGDHTVPKSGQGIERLPETRPYQFGDGIQDLDVTQTMHNALLRHGLEDIRLNEDDLEVYETEHLSSCSTVLMIDISHTMIL